MAIDLRLDWPMFCGRSVARSALSDVKRGRAEGKVRENVCGVLVLPGVRGGREYYVK